MASKADKFYFDNFSEAADQSLQAAQYLVACLNDYHPDNLEEMLTEMHEIEHIGDGKKHEMSAALAKAFVTPVDREDLALISQNLDEVTDAVEEVLQRFYMHDIRTVIPDAIAFANKLVECCVLMKAVLAEFVNFKKPAKLHELIVSLNNVEEECDQLYVNATRNIRTQCTDVLEILAWREIFEKMEHCADAAEHVGDCVETVVMKNT